MDTQTMQQVIDAAFDDIAAVSAETQGDVRDAVNGALDALDSGALRVAEKAAKGGDWQVNQWLKKAVLLSFPSQ
jgi:2,3,4,5-tetrahydropyridine-2-carboxylate N-succinyltransferase